MVNLIQRAKEARTKSNATRLELTLLTGGSQLKDVRAAKVRPNLRPNLCPVKSGPALVRNRRGQSLIVVAMMMVTFLFFFKFVIDTGLIVSAKINLQNAADLAAYSGASTQARQMNHIAFLNYEMRRQYKKFLFRYYVLGTAFQSTRSNTPFQGFNQPRIFSPSGNGDPKTNFQVPTVCIPIRSCPSTGGGTNGCVTQNLCQNTPQATLAIRSPPANPQDALMQSLNQLIAGLNDLRGTACEQDGVLNGTILLNWLYNGDPDLVNLQTRMLAQGTDAATQARAAFIYSQLKTVSNGLGILPTEILLRERIRTLTGYINKPPLKPVTMDAVKNLESQLDKAQNERTIQAFYSAYYTLGPHSFQNGQDLTMDELIQFDGPTLLNLADVNLNFTAYYEGFDTYHPPAGGPPANPDGVQNGDCIPATQAFPVIGLPVGVYKNGNSLVHYAVRLKAKTKLFFSSVFGGSVELTAYSAAQPFGSRIGPKPTLTKGGANPFPFDQMVTNLCPPAVRYGSSTSYGATCDPFATGELNSVPGNVPNILMRTDDRGRLGFLDQGVIASFAEIANLGTQFALSYEDLLKGYDAAMAPNPIERGHYVIPNDETKGGVGDPYQLFFTPPPGTLPLQTRDDSLPNGTRTILGYAFWAPIVAPGSTATQDPAQLVSQIMAQNAQFSRPEFAAVAQDTNIGLTSYIKDKLKDRIGVNTESLNVAVITDPVNRAGTSGIKTPITLRSPLLMNQVDDLRTSWITHKSDTANTGGDIVGPAGRVGYSVKFVAFKALANPNGMTVDGTNAWSNPLNLQADPAAQEDGAATELAH